MVDIGAFNLTAYLAGKPGSGNRGLIQSSFGLITKDSADSQVGRLTIETLDTLMAAQRSNTNLLPLKFSIVIDLMTGVASDSTEFQFEGLPYTSQEITVY